MIHCFYHSSDLDGHCSGAIVKLAQPEAKLHGIDYGQEFPWDQIDREDTVFMVDFSLQPAEGMIRLHRSCNLVWIDHHKSAIEHAEKHGYSHISGIRKVGTAACELCWMYLDPGDEVPEVVRLLGRYDVWDQSDMNYWKQTILPFQKGFKASAETDPLKAPRFFWSDWLGIIGESKRVDGICVNGRDILRKTARSNQAYVEKCGYEIEFEGLRCIACNKGLTNSQLFDSVFNPERHDAMLAYYHVRGEYWTISLYSTKSDVDVSVIAKKYGGGGHKGAAGFQCNELPF